MESPPRLQLPEPPEYQSRPEPPKEDPALLPGGSGLHSPDHTITEQSSPRLSPIARNNDVQASQGFALSRHPVDDQNSATPAALQNAECSPFFPISDFDGDGDSTTEGVDHEGMEFLKFETYWWFPDGGLFIVMPGQTNYTLAKFAATYGTNEKDIKLWVERGEAIVEIENNRLKWTWPMYSRWYGTYSGHFNGNQRAIVWDTGQRWIRIAQDPRVEATPPSKLKDAERVSQIGTKYGRLSSLSDDSISVGTPVHRKKDERRRAQMKELEKQQEELRPKFRQEVILDLGVSSEYIGKDGEVCQVPLQDADGAEPFKIHWLRKVGLLHRFIEFNTQKRLVAETEVKNNKLAEMVSSFTFEAFMGAIIVANAFCLGIELMYAKGEEKPVPLVAADHLFIGVFLVELCLRIRAFTFMWVFSIKNAFDVFLVVVTGVVTSWIWPYFAPVPDWLQRMQVLRIFRLVRLARTIRVIPFFNELWTLIAGLSGCFYLLFWAFVVLLVMDFVFAVAIIETISKSPQYKDNDHVQIWFGDLYGALFSLLQVMTFDSWSYNLWEIIMDNPEGMFIFFLYFGVCGILLFNLITAIVVGNALDLKKNDDELTSMQKSTAETKFRNQLLMVFQDLDEDNSGELTMQEFQDCLDDPSFIRQMKILDIEVDELPDIFEILDDGDGTVSAVEFTEGFTRMSGNALERDMMGASKKMGEAASKARSIVDHLSDVVDTSLGRAQNDLATTAEGFGMLQVLCLEILKKMTRSDLRAVAQSTRGIAPPQPDIPTDAELRRDDNKVQRKMDSIGTSTHEEAQKYLSRLEKGKDFQCRLEDGGRGHLPLLPQSWSKARVQQRASGKMGRVASLTSDTNDGRESMTINDFKNWWDMLGLNSRDPCSSPGGVTASESCNNLDARKATLEYKRGEALLQGELMADQSHLVTACASAREELRRECEFESENENENEEPCEKPCEGRSRDRKRVRKALPPAPCARRPPPPSGQPASLTITKDSELRRSKSRRGRSALVTCH